MTAIWLTIAALCLGTVALRAAGPAMLGQRRPSPRAMAVIGLVAPAVLTALVLSQTFSDTTGGFTLDARIVGVGVAVLAAAARAPVLLVILLAALATAATRALGG